MTPISPTVSIKSLHNEYNSWMKELCFAKDQISFFENHLVQFVNTQNRYTAAHVEKFQNQFICQKEVIDILKHDLHISERQLAAFVKELSGMGLESIKMDNHVKLRDRISTFRKLFKELKDNFHAFEAKAS